MKVGDLYRVIKNGHTKTRVAPQLGDLIIVTRFVGSSYVEGINTKTGNRHHYLKVELEKL